MNFFKVAAIAAALAGAAGTANATDYVCSNDGVPCAFDQTTGGFSNVKVGPFETAADSFDITFDTAGVVTFSFTANRVSFGTFSFAGIEFNPISGLSDSFQVAAGTTYTLVTSVTNGTSTPAAYSGAIDFAAVPEPASWGMMIGGFALGGAALRRRRRVQALVAA